MGIFKVFIIWANGNTFARTYRDDMLTIEEAEEILEKYLFFGKIKYGAIIVNEEIYTEYEV